VRTSQDQGFALPLALIGALAVLLSASSALAMALGSRQQLQLELQQIQAVDELASAAQQWAQRLQGPWSCLREYPASSWSTAGCGSSPPPTSAVLKDWQPSAAGGGEFWLQRQDGGLQRRFLWNPSGLKERK
jgi:type II secretory pathway pseudopilin PulG